MSRVLVTGGNGYLGTRLIADLLLGGTEVRTTVRSAASEPGLREALRRAGADDSGLEIVHASLTEDEGWASAAAGVDGVYHVASPMIQSANPDDIVIPARDGALRVLRAARDARVPRVVLTSSFAAIGYSPKPVRDYDESDWTDPATPGLAAYPLSKAVAERAAWDFIEREGDETELVVVNPTWIAGPTLTVDARSSLQLFAGMLSGAMTQVPRQRFGIADVRDVAAVHIAAMTTPGAAGKRYLALADGATLTFLDVAQVLRSRLGAFASRVPTEEAPGDEPAPLVIHNDRAKAELGFRPRPAVDTIVETAESLRDLGLV
ncbi:NAD-dependent epimerase/dehydratase family protein [Subtercola endophyticus]|uniref:NAD-dependent epimerase/dehydratase family protein n=1 Tax=Subtercola endophyticus TaxID=2895559 RepID=UPI001E625124|nr:NAD-dependent epimerase/dehydratase family protein [Subtercola endophyticus]UFS60559.1 NAD-dependent epimerase/dehydratase family protein [Subtercola endophyticus]